MSFRTWSPTLRSPAAWVLVVALTGCAVDAGPGADVEQGTPQVTEPAAVETPGAAETEPAGTVPAPTSPDTQPPDTRSEAGLVPVFEDGTWLVGEEIEPGVYETIDDDLLGCYWERLSGLGGTFDEIIANNYAEAHEVVEIDPGDEAFSSSGCGGWVELTPRDPLLTVIPPGRWAVNVHIAPGRYRSVGGDDTCYWERLSGFGGTFDEIIANDLGAGSIVDIAESDAGFASSGCGSWEPVG
ncbi:MAG: hypothetical protein KatS3mg011_1625 [Acidimicrobiia bacterium]|nr:MAG: hypothetical protein KatS3mg011_1625 [Acidimicrobiia bacterium]